MAQPCNSFHITLVLTFEIVISGISCYCFHPVCIGIFAQVVSVNLTEAFTFFTPEQVLSCKPIFHIVKPFQQVSGEEHTLDTQLVQSWQPQQCNTCLIRTMLLVNVGLLHII